MKKLHCISLLILLSLFLNSCKQEKQVMEQKFANGNVIVHVEGTRSSLLEPWHVELRVNAYQTQQSKVNFEFQNSKLDDSVVKFDWNDQSGNVVFTGGDDKFSFHIEADEEHLRLTREVQ